MVPLPRRAMAEPIARQGTRVPRACESGTSSKASEGKILDAAERVVMAAARPGRDDGRQRTSDPRDPSGRARPYHRTLERLQIGGGEAIVRARRGAHRAFRRRKQENGSTGA